MAAARGAGMSPALYVLVGLPGSGKSTHAEGLKRCCAPGCVIVSTDALIEEYAVRAGKTYNDVFSEYIAEATSLVNSLVEEAVEMGDDIIWDQTNLSARKRVEILNRFPPNYLRVAHVVTCDEEVRQGRLSARVGKTVPLAVDASMRDRFTEPTPDEGFDMIVRTQT